MKWMWFALLATPLAAQGITQHDMANMRQQIAACWNPPAHSVDVTVGFELDITGKVVGDVTLVSGETGETATQDAFRAARLAVLRCQQDGYDLPKDAFAAWQFIELRFALPEPEVGS